MTRNEEVVLWGLGLLWLGGKLEQLVPALTPAAKAVERGGSKLYEATHPWPHHEDDLPGKQLTRAQVLDIATRAGFPNPRLATAIAMAESGGVPNGKAITDRELSVGLWQINLLAHPEYTAEAMADVWKNAAAAFKISKGGTDWRPWSTWWADANHRIGPGRGRYRLFL